MKRTLVLKSEVLTALTDDELGGLVGAADAITGASCPAAVCKLSVLHPQCPSAFTCPTE
ncbi:MAG TPA: hypothetical protein VF519_07020 [Mycobacteriales bacterium]|jgi:hypothetical protein